MIYIDEDISPLKIKQGCLEKLQLTKTHISEVPLEHVSSRLSVYKCVE